MIRRLATDRAGAVVVVLAASSGVTAQAGTPAPPTPTPIAAPATSAPANAAANTRFSFYGLAPAAAGLAQAQAESALGQAFKPEAALPGRVGSALALAASAAVPICQYQSVDSQPGVRFTLAADVVSRAETRDGRYATLSGVHVGDTLDRALQAYGKRLSVGAHPYFDKGQTLTIFSSDRRFALVMESNDSGRIITLRGGRMPDVGWLEGCS